MDASLGTSYQYHDHLSTRVEADASANVTRTFGHFPFGETWYETGTASKWKFTSYERAGTGESDLDYADFRFDSSRLGRFMSSDPLAGNLDGPPSLDLYGYVLNDPVNLTDSTGMDPFLGCLLNELGNCSPGKTFSFSFDLGGNINACSGNGGLLDSFCAATHLGTQEFLARFQSYGIHDPVKEGMDPVGDMYKKYAGGLPGVCGPEVCPDSYTFKRQDRYLECDESRFCVWVNWVEATPIGAYNAALAPILTIKGSGAPKRHPPTVPR